LPPGRISGGITPRIYSGRKLPSGVVARNVASVAEKDLEQVARWFDTGEVAALLHLDRKAVERAFRRGDIPAERNGGRWRIEAAALVRAIVDGFGATSPALRPALRTKTLRGRPRQRRAFIRRSPTIER